MRAPMKIAVLRLGAMGDILFTTPALRALKAAYPSSHLTYIMLREWRFVLKRNPNVDRLVGLRHREPKALGPLLGETFDLVVNLHELEDGARLCQALRAQRRLGHQWIDGRLEPDANSSLLVKDTETLDALRERNVSYPELYCRIAGVPAAESLRYDFDPGPWAEWLARRAARRLGLEGVAPIALHTHSRGSESKAWPTLAVVRLVRSMARARFLVLGFRSDRPVTRALETEPNVAVSYDPMPVQAALLRRCALFVGVDSGPRQMAAAMGVRALCLFGPRPPELLPAFEGDRSLTVRWPCSPCFMDCCPLGRVCMEGIETRRIAQTIEEMLAE